MSKEEFDRLQVMDVVWMYNRADGLAKFVVTKTPRPYVALGQIVDGSIEKPLKLEPQHAFRIWNSPQEAAMAYAHPTQEALENELRWIDRLIQDVRTGIPEDKLIEDYGKGYQWD